VVPAHRVGATPTLTFADSMFPPHSPSFPIPHFVITTFGLSFSGGKLDQTTLTDVRLVPPPGELDETRESSLVPARSLHYVKT